MDFWEGILILFPGGEAPGIRISIRIPGDVVYVWILGVSYVYQVPFFRQITDTIDFLREIDNFFTKCQFIGQF